MDTMDMVAGTEVTEEDMVVMADMEVDMEADMEVDMEVITADTVVMEATDMEDKPRLTFRSIL